MTESEYKAAMQCLAENGHHEALTAIHDVFVNERAARKRVGFPAKQRGKEPVYVYICSLNSRASITWDGISG